MRCASTIRSGSRVEAHLGTRHVVIKAAVPDGSEPGGDLRKEIRANDAARAVGVPVPPRALWYEGPSAVYVAEYVGVDELAAGSSDSAWRATGAALRRLHTDAATEGFPYSGGVGDPPVDLMPAWNLLPGGARETFRRELDADDAAWERGRGWALSQAIIALPHYVDTNPGMAETARRTLAALFG